MSETYGFLSSGQLAQQQPLQQTAAPLGPSTAQQQAQAAQLAAALQGLQQQGQQSKTPDALGTNLLAQALMNYGQGQQQNPNSWQGPGSGFLNLGMFGGGNTSADDT